jgi:hypothetical protein
MARTYKIKVEITIIEKEKNIIIKKEKGRINELDSSKIKIIKK